MAPSTDESAESTSELTLFDLSGWLLVSTTITGFASGGLLCAGLPADAATSLPSGRQVRFQCTLPSGEVRGLAEVATIEAAAPRLQLRLLQIDNDEGLPRLLDALYAWTRRA